MQGNKQADELGALLLNLTQSHLPFCLQIVEAILSDKEDESRVFFHANLTTDLLGRVFVPLPLNATHADQLKLEVVALTVDEGSVLLTPELLAEFLFGRGHERQSGESERDKKPLSNKERNKYLLKRPRQSFTLKRWYYVSGSGIKLLPHSDSGHLENWTKLIHCPMSSGVSE